MTSKDLPFEDAIKELEKLVEAMESGDLSLDESLQSFQRGIRLTRHCQSILEQAQQTVEVLMNPEDDTSAAPLDPDQDQDASAQSS